MKPPTITKPSRKGQGVFKNAPTQNRTIIIQTKPRSISIRESSVSPFGNAHLDCSIHVFFISQVVQRFWIQKQAELQHTASAPDTTGRSTARVQVLANITLQDSAQKVGSIRACLCCCDLSQNWVRREAISA